MIYLPEMYSGTSSAGISSQETCPKATDNNDTCNQFSSGSRNGTNQQKLSENAVEEQAPSVTDGNGRTRGKNVKRSKSSEVKPRGRSTSCSKTTVRHRTPEKPCQPRKPRRKSAGTPIKKQQERNELTGKKTVKDTPNDKLSKMCRFETSDCEGDCPASFEQRKPRGKKKNKHVVEGSGDKVPAAPCVYATGSKKGFLQRLLRTMKPGTEDKFKSQQRAAGKTEKATASRKEVSTPRGRRGKVKGTFDGEPSRRIGSKERQNSKVPTNRKSQKKKHSIDSDKCEHHEENSGGEAHPEQQELRHGATTHGKRLNKVSEPDLNSTKNLETLDDEFLTAAAELRRVLLKE